MKRLFLTFSLVLAAVCGPSTPARACSCTYYPEFLEAFTQSQAVFLGEVIDIAPLPPAYGDVILAVFRVEQQWKGTPSQTFHIVTASNDGLCGFHFTIGERYLMYGLNGNFWGPPYPDALATHSCHRSHVYYPEDPDLVLLGPTPAGPGSWGTLKVRYR